MGWLNLEHKWRPKESDKPSEESRRVVVESGWPGRGWAVRGSAPGRWPLRSRCVLWRAEQDAGRGSGSLSGTGRLQCRPV